MGDLTVVRRKESVLCDSSRYQTQPQPSQPLPPPRSDQDAETMVLSTSAPPSNGQNDQTPPTNDPPEKELKAPALQAATTILPEPTSQSSVDH